MKLVSNGKSTWRIVIDKNPSPSAELAAQELQKYFRLVTGADLPVMPLEKTQPGERLLVGQSGMAAVVGEDLSSPDLGEEGFVIKSIGRDILLAGESGAGTLYAAYELIERFLGVRWFDEPIGEVVPKTGSIEAPDVNILEKPAFPIRGADIHFFDKPEEFMVCLDWMGKNRVNWVLTFLNQDELVRKFLPELQKRGIHVNMGGHSLQNFLYDYVNPDGSKDGYTDLFIHPVETNITRYRRRRDRMFAAHPEWHALVEGRRLPAETLEGQLCFTNPGLVDHITEAVISYLDRAPYVEILSLWPVDEYAVHCECPACLKTGKEDALLLFINRVAAKVARAHPDVLLETINYSECTRPSRRERPEPNVIISFAPWDRDYFTPFDSTQRKNAQYARHLRGWLEIVRSEGRNNPVYLFEYYKYTPSPKSLAIQADAKQFRAMGLAGVMEAFPFHRGISAFFNGYFLYKFLWNPDRNGEALRADAVRSAFSGLEQGVTECLGALEKILPVGRYVTIHWERLWRIPPVFFVNSLAHHRQALVVVEQCRQELTQLKSACADGEVSGRLERVLSVLDETAAHIRPLIPQLEAMALIRETRGKNPSEQALEQAQAKLNEALTLAGKTALDNDAGSITELVAYFDLPENLVRLVAPLAGIGGERVAMARRHPRYRSCLRDKAEYGCDDCALLECPDYIEDDRCGRYRLDS